MIEQIPTPSPEVFILRETRNTTFFRPSAVGKTRDKKTKVRCEMETAEERFLLHAQLASLACAAHYSYTDAKENAEKELIERLSISSWWTYRRPVAGSLEKDLLSELRTELDLPSNFSLRVGYINAVQQIGQVCFAIIKDMENFPYAVLGGACHENSLKAAKKASYEALQSWGASAWLKKQSKMKTPYWDVPELVKRHDETALSKPIAISKKSIKSFRLSDISSSLHYESGLIEDINVVSIGQHEDFAGRSRDYAKMVKNRNELDEIFSEHIF